MSRSPSPVTADLADLRTVVRQALAAVALLAAVAAMLLPFATEYDPNSDFAKVTVGSWDAFSVVQLMGNHPAAKVVLLAFPAAMIAICVVAGLAWAGLAPRPVVMVWIGASALAVSVAAAVVPLFGKPHLVTGTWETAAGPYLGVVASVWVLLTMRRLGEF
jgi:hypothetical protein